MNSMAMATFCTSVIWLLLCEVREEKIRFKVIDWVYIITCTSIYITTNLFVRPIWGGIIYYATLLICTFFMEKECLEYAMNLVKTSVCYLR